MGGHLTLTMRMSTVRSIVAFLRGLRTRVAQDRLTVIAAGVAFYAMLTIFPALAALVAIYGLALDPPHLTEQLASMAALLPPQAAELLTRQLLELAGVDRTALSFSAAGGLVLSLWSTSTSVRALMMALNVAYDAQEERGFFKRMSVSLLLTLGAIAGGIIAIIAVVLAPVAIAFLGLEPVLHGAVSFIRWPVVAAMFWLGVLAVYRYGPSRPTVGWSWINWGAAVATVLWLAGSVLFSWYVATFANYNKTYGSFAATAILLFWFLLSAYAVLIGAEINAQLESKVRHAEAADPRDSRGEPNCRQ